MRLRMTVLIFLVPLFALAETSVIQGGVGLAGFKLGAAFESVQKQLGKPPQVKRSPSDPKSGMAFYPEKGLAFLLNREQTIIGITVTEAKYRTSAGIGVGSSVDQVKAAYGNGLSRGAFNLSFPDHGLSFAFTDRKVTHVYVTKIEESQAMHGDRLIVPGARAGEIRLGAAPAVVERVLGKPDRVGHLKGGLKLWTYKDKGLRLVMSEGVEGILITTGDFITSEGVKVGATSADIKRSFGPHGEKTSRGLFYRQRGIGFLLERDQTIEIQVLYPRGDGKSGG